MDLESFIPLDLAHLDVQELQYALIKLYITTAATMRTIVVLLSFVLLLHAGSDARPIRPPWPSPATDLSSLSLPEEPFSAEQLEVQEYKNQQVDDYGISFRLNIVINYWLIFLFVIVDSTLTHLFDENDIVPDEHTYFGSDTPFNLDEYFHINPPGILPPLSFFLSLLICSPI